MKFLTQCFNRKNVRNITIIGGILALIIGITGVLKMPVQTWIVILYYLWLAVAAATLIAAFFRLLIRRDFGVVPFVAGASSLATVIFGLLNLSSFQAYWLIATHQTELAAALDNPFANAGLLNWACVISIGAALFLVYRMLTLSHDHEQTISPEAKKAMQQLDKAYQDLNEKIEDINKK